MDFETDSLFPTHEISSKSGPSEVDRSQAPLPVRVAPRSLEEFIGQEHILGPGKLLRRLIETDRLSSAIFYGPPGTGKTALARIIARTTRATFESLNAVTSGVKELRELIARARQRLSPPTKHKTILFIDEIHRYNRAQQDALLPDVEAGTVVLIGATTMNPFFSLTSPLLSRSRIFEFKPLSETELEEVVRRALAHPLSGFEGLKVELDADALAHIISASEGDARKALTALEVAVLSTPPVEGVVAVTRAIAEECTQRKAIVYDGTGDEHYDTISAFIKSLRGSNPDAALYWMAKMLKAGEDPRFIARRLVICAAEDVGNADPQALVVATAAMHALEFVGLPEGQIPLAQATTYIASAPKSNASYMALSAASKAVEEEPEVRVPRHLQDASYGGSQRLGRGKGYQYPHDFPGHYIKQYYGVERGKFYQPAEQGYEKKIKEYLESLDKAGEGS